MAARYYKALRSGGSLEELQIKLWRAVCAGEEALKAASDPEELRKSLHAFSQVCQTYLKVFESSELVARMDEIKKLIQENPGSQGIKL